MFWIIISNKFLLRFYLGEAYIKGGYKGIATPIVENKEKDKEIALRNDIDQDESNVSFSIKQTIFGTEISGVSFNKNDGKLRSTWTGTAFKVERNKFYFGIEISKKTVGYAIMVLTFNDDLVTGFYYPAKLDYGYIVKFEGKKAKIANEIFDDGRSDSPQL
ncbi:hypothetical protein [Thiothrix unzii]|uniref:Uncharacterized protein n=1 Tax=Thiothrix unzii TaxID=111769 RepID=A0A975F702_9GAMM|nr:hypothetical protein [Thiothrix unzii]QTR52213.1 hypothetical protein J9260_10715 [Thiothrix unzii]